jgi:hypothetical protein
MRDLLRQKVDDAPRDEPKGGSVHLLVAFVNVRDTLGVKVGFDSHLDQPTQKRISNQSRVQKNKVGFDGHLYQSCGFAKLRFTDVPKFESHRSAQI